MTRALLALEDGSLFWGDSIGAHAQAVGEVVFNTAMTGYQEILTDPSYCRQIVTLTCPHIGNVGTNDEDEESTRVFASGLVVRDVPAAPSSWRAQASLGEYLCKRGAVGIAGIDTRRLTRRLRERGALSGCLWAGEDIDTDAAVAVAKSFPGLAGMDLARDVSVTESYQWRGGQSRKSESWASNRQGLSAGDDAMRQQNNVGSTPWRVIAYDFGIKRNILRILVSSGCEVTVVPAATTAGEVLAMDPDGVFLSNGPGDPEPCSYAIEAIRTFLDTGVPVFGICLGHQLLALASGARTVKMKFGHHGANHPVARLDDGSVIITSQNHGFAVDEDSLPANLVATHRSLFDKSLQGIQRSDRPAFGFQGHPEASPGPREAGELFDRFITMMAQGRRTASSSAS